jgi:hypothetical protein
MSYERSPRLVCSMTIGTYMRGSIAIAVLLTCPKYTTGAREAA